MGFKDPIELKELIGLAVDCSVQEDLENNKEAIVENTSKLLMSKRAMLDDYFSLTFNKDGFVTSIPMLLSKHFKISDSQKEACVSSWIYLVLCEFFQYSQLLP